MRRRTLLTGMLAASTAAALAGCSTAPAPGTGSSGAGSLAGQSITVYNAQHEELTRAWAEGFTKQTGVAVTLRNGDDSELANQLIQEGAASPADVFITENSPAMTAVDNAHLFSTLAPATVAQVPVAYRPGTQTWTGVAARATVLVYNPSMIDEASLPASLLDLQQSRWKGKWAASPSGADFQAIVSAVLAEQGAAATESWLAGMKRNAEIYKGNSTVMKAVNDGQVAMGVIYHYYWYIDQVGTKENSANTKLHFFKNEDPGAFTSVSGGGVLASSTKQAAAQAFLRYVTGEAGQDVLRTGASMEYPVGSGVAPNAALPTLTDLQSPTIDPATLNGTQVSELMTRTGLL